MLQFMEISNLKFSSFWNFEKNKEMGFYCLDAVYLP